jgi:hypothetical protein
MVTVTEGKMIRRWLCPSIAILLCLVASAGAQENKPDTHMQAADDLLQVLHVERSVNDAIDIMLKAQLQANPQMAQFDDILRAYLAKYMAWDALRGDYARMYADTFTEVEMKQLMTFYRTPVGQKLIDTLPVIMKKGAELGQAKVSAHLDELKAQVTARVEELQKREQTQTQTEKP